MPHPNEPKPLTHDQIRAAMLRKELTVKALAELMDVSSTTVQNWKAGVGGRCCIHCERALRSVLGVR